MNPTILAVAVIAAGAIVASFVLAGRYIAVGDGKSMYVVDRFTGAVRECSYGECRPASEGPVRPVAKKGPVLAPALTK